MKTARAADLRRELQKTGPAWPTRIENISYQGVVGLGTGELNLSSPVTLISGGNGAGKSTLLQATWAALDPPSARTSPFIGRRLNAGTVTVTLQDSGTKHSCQVDFSPAGVAGECHHKLEIAHIDTASRLEAINSILDDLSKTEGFTNEIGSYDLTNDELGEISFVTRRDYKSATLYEIEHINQTVPYFEVSYGEDRYDSRTMGAGEHAAFLIWWLLRRAPKCSVILLEEPETFLSPASQDALGVHITAVAVEKRLCVLIATHSGPMIAPAGPASTQFMFRAAQGIDFNNDAPPALLKQLGVDPPVRAIVLVEDAAGEAFCRHILEKYDVKLARAVDVSVMSGDGNVFRGLSVMESTRRVKVVGLGPVD